MKTNNLNFTNLITIISPWFIQLIHMYQKPHSHTQPRIVKSITFKK